jgi:hypothetical protein
MVKTKLIEEVVYSPVNDHRIKAQLRTSPIWRTCYKKEEITKEIMQKHGGRMYAYTFKFDGTKVIQHTKTEKVK